MIKKWHLRKVVIIVFFIFLGCKREEALPASETSTKEIPSKIENEELKKIVKLLPSPIEIANLIGKVGATYNREILNDIMNVTKYQSRHHKAYNLGVYGMDMAYSLFFNESNEMIRTLSAVKKLYDELGIGMSFQDSLLRVFEANANNSRELQKILTDLYSNTSMDLKELRQNDLWDYAMLGALVEGLFIITHYAPSSKIISSPEVIARIRDQKETIDLSIEWIQNKKGFDTLKMALQKIRDYFNYFEESSQTTQKPLIEGISSPAANNNVVSVPVKISIKPEKFEELKREIGTLRNKIINASI